MATATLTWAYTHTNELGFECERKSGNLASANPFGFIGQTNTGVLTFVDSTVAEGSTSGRRRSNSRASVTRRWVGR